MGFVLLILYWLWIIIKHILIVAGVFTVFLIPAYLLGALTSKFRCVLVLPIVTMILVGKFLLIYRFNTFETALLAALFIESIIYVISVFRTFRVKVIRNLSFYKVDGVFEVAIYLMLVFAIMYYLNINYFDEIFSNWVFMQFEAFRIHFYIVLGMIAIYGLIPSSSTLRDYQYVKDLLIKDGWLSEGLLYYYALEALKEDSSSKSEKEVKANNRMQRCSEICKMIVRHEHGYVTRKLTQDYFFSEACYIELEKEINRLVNSSNGIKFDELFTKIDVPFSKDDVKILLNDYVPQYRMVNKLNSVYIINTSSKLNNRVCDCCNTIVEEPIINEHGIFCSEVCFNVEIGFIKPTSINETVEKATISGVVTANVGAINTLYNNQQYYNNKPLNSRHGYAAEIVNTDIDSVLFNKAEVLGRDNAKNGADRVLNGIEMQSKYYSSGAKSINAAFDSDSGIFKYFNSEGKPMPIEVPSNQYDEAVKQMAKRISEDQVPGYDNPADADKLIHKGWLTYNQAKNVAKPMTIESLVYDGAHGVIIGLETMGIGATVAFAVAIWNGASFEDAVDVAINAGGKSFTIALVTSISTTQIAKTEIGRNISRSITEKYGKKAMGKVVVGSNVAVSFAMVTYRDFYHFFSGSISSAQLFKNVAVAGSSMATGLVVGASIGGAPGAIIGGIAGATAGMATKYMLDQFVDDDVKMLKGIFELQFEIHSRDYLLSRDDITYINNKLGKLDMNNVFKQMYASYNRYQYVSILIKPLMIECYERKIDLASA